MATYFLMGLPFIAAVIFLDVILLKTRVIVQKKCWIVMAIMIVITAFFDQFLTGLPIVHYTHQHISGVYIFYAPIEDFMYTFAAVIGLGSLMLYAEKRQA